ncbi:Major facilitator superfamily protein [Prunus dulcis]|uniref:Major facilitator superfamily protein n=1 Tax=Prunus dulcis TaxID=3755 RepID=A0A4Y1RU45_PRUDU|nr:Major facilitator superfamily protein [Prunus dulcis]
MGLKRSFTYQSTSSRSKPGFFKSLPAMRTRKIFGISLSLILINFAAIMERADENLLPSVYKEVSEAFNAGPSDLGYLTFIRNFVQGMASPLAVGASRLFAQVAFWRAVNGFGLAIVIPALQSFIADSYKDGVRGAGFGMVSLVGSLGGIGGGVLATLMAGEQYWNVPGWRCAFILMASLSSLIGFLVLLFVVDPRKTVNFTHGTDHSSDREDLIIKGPTSAASVWLESWTAMKAVVKVQTFQIIVLQGIVGSLPWTAMVFFTMWFELIGFDHNSTAALLSLFAVGCAMGSLLGGLIADRMSRIYPHSGRIMCAQFSAFMGIPFSWFLLKVIPQSVSSYYTFAVTLLLMGLTISWNATAANGPMFAEVVPVKHRTMIYAFDRAFEGSFSSFAAPLVGILSEKMFGYDAKSVDPIKGSTREAFALSQGLLTMMAVPFGLKDRENARMASVKEEEMR